MKRRFTLPIAHVNYEVLLSRKAPKADGEVVQGYCDYKAREIAVHLHGNIEVVRQTLWHEAVHAILQELGRSDLSHNEAFVEGLALSIARIRLEEPWL